MARNPHAVALGQLGASKGGYARAEKLSAEELSKQGRVAAQARWATVKPCPVCGKRHRSRRTVCQA
jgi:hypothetical protein